MGGASSLLQESRQPIEVIHLHCLVDVFVRAGNLESSVNQGSCRRLNLPQPLVLSLQRLVPGPPPLVFGAGGGELLSDRPFLLPRIAEKVPKSGLSVLVTHRATGEGVGSPALPRLLLPTPRIAKRAPLRYIRHR